MSLYRCNLDLRCALVLLSLLVSTTTWPSITSLIRQALVTGVEVEGGVQDGVASFKRIPFAR
ncbi:MAG TPA: hypothetical protein VF908_05680 [Gemmatimonadaceae bacterium]